MFHWYLADNLPIFTYGLLWDISMFLLWKKNEIFVEPEDGEEQTITVDCSICCRPNVLTIRIIGEQIIINSEFEG